MFKIPNGVRPDRPPSGLSDTLWELLETTWVVQNYQQSQGRPDAGTVLDRLKKCVDHEGEPIDPLVPESRREDGGCLHVPPTMTGSDDDITVKQNSSVSDFYDRIDHPGSIYLARRDTKYLYPIQDVGKAHIPPLSWILAMVIAVLCAALAVRKLSP